MFYRIHYKARKFDTSLENSPSFLLYFSEREMNGEAKHFYQFKSFRLDVRERNLSRDGEVVPLTPKAFDVLAVLVERNGHLVEKNELLRIVWADSFVEEANVARIVHTLRKVLGEDENGNKFIETVAKKGYRFVAETTETSENESKPLPNTLLFSSTSPETKEVSASIVENSSKTESSQYDFPKNEFLQRPKSLTLLVLTTSLVLAVTITVFWFSKDLSLTKPVVKNAPRQTLNGEAYQHYQQGKFLLERKLKGDQKLALESFEKAIELDPNYAAAYVGKADAKIWMFWSSGSHNDISQARTAVTKSLELDETNSYAHTLLCRIKATYDWDFNGGEKECRRAVELDPDSAEAHSELAHFLNVLGRENEALNEIGTTVKLAPTSFNKRSRGVILYYSRRYDEAIEQLRQVAETDPNFSMAGKWIMRSYEMKNDYAHALEWRLRQLEQNGSTPEEVAALKSTYEKNGWRGVLRNMIDSRKTNDTRGKELGFTETAIMYCQLGENERAFEFLDKAYEQRELFMTHIGREPRLDSLRTDLRFEELEKLIGLK